MLLSKTVKMKWNVKTKKWYESKGYTYTKMGDTFEVKIEDLQDGSGALVSIQCDYCGKIIENCYKDYKKIMDKNIINKHACKNCKSIKQKEMLEEKCKRKLISKNDIGYYSFKENRMNLLNNYIKKNKCFNQLYTDKEVKVILRLFKNHGHDIIEAINELGYNASEVFYKKPNHYYDEFKNLEKEINGVIEKYNRFPTIEEIYNETKIDSMHIVKHGGINKIINKMGYNNEYNLVDKRGFRNSSSYEYIVASFLIENNIPYKREKHPFSKKEGKYRSDFMFELENNEKIHCEVWGYYENENAYYNEVKRKKIDLYNKYNIKLISIDRNIFQSNNMATIQKKLYKIFNNFFKLKFKELTFDVLFPKSNLTDEEILNKIMKYSKNEEILPVVSVLKKNGMYYLYNEILKRYGSYYEFANKVQKIIIRHQSSYWTKDVIFKYFRDINNEEIMINRVNMRKYEGLCDKIVDLGGLIKWKLEYFNTNNFIPIKEELKWLENVTNNKGTNIKNRVNPEQQVQAKEILKKLNN